MREDESCLLINSRPDYPVYANNNVISDQLFRNFDLQSEQLKGCDQDYIQLSNGPFEGRFLSVELGKTLSFHFEFANQRLEQNIGFPPDMISLGLIFGGNEPYKVNGAIITEQDLLVSKPGGEMHMLSPENGSVLAICFNRSDLVQHPTMANLINFFEKQSDSVSIYGLPELTRRLREDSMTAINTMANLGEDTEQQNFTWLETATINCLLGQLDLHITGLKPIDQIGENSHFRVCQQIYNTLARQPDQILDYRILSQTTGFSRRSLQLASKTYLNLSPGQYSRALRLNNARRLLNRGLAPNQTIGDIADHTGFAGWSRFTRYYANLFGELPSETLAR